LLHGRLGPHLPPGYLVCAIVIKNFPSRKVDSMSSGFLRSFHLLDVPSSALMLAQICPPQWGHSLIISGEFTFHVFRFITPPLASSSNISYGMATHQIRGTQSPAN
jgi:hypothetical protein